MMLSTSATSWFRFYSDAKRSRSSYGNLANNSAAFSSVSLSDRHNALRHGPEDLYLVLGLKATKIDFLLIHHPIVYELEDGDGPVVFAFIGPSARANVVRLLPGSLQVITDLEEALFTPSFGMLLDDDAMNNFGADDYLGMAVDETNPLSFSASIPLPPFAFAVLEQFGSSANWQNSFLSFIECLSNYKDIHGDDIKAAAFLPARILWWLMKQANTTTPTAAYKAFIGRLPPLPVIEKLDEIPPPVIAAFNEVTEHRLQRKWPSGATLKTSSDDTSKDDDEDKDEEGSNDDDDSNTSSSKKPNKDLADYKAVTEELREIDISGEPSDTARSHKEQGKLDAPPGHNRVKEHKGSLPLKQHTTSGSMQIKSVKRTVHMNEKTVGLSQADSESENVKRDGAWNFMENVKRPSDIVDQSTWDELFRYASELLVTTKALSEDEALECCLTIGITPEKLELKPIKPVAKLIYPDSANAILEGVVSGKGKVEQYADIHKYRKEPSALYSLLHCSDKDEQELLMVLPLSAKSLYLLVKFICQFFTVRAERSGQTFNRSHISPLINAVFYTNATIMAGILESFIDGALKKLTNKTAKVTKKRNKPLKM
ncbi:hypothetical protein MPSEU_000528600 [Mayamaea pseudoterrestris]|nr:hypothetical protein MPSEU_000528600 [Mayamaea pseudoterrestris]